MKAELGADVISTWKAEYDSYYNSMREKMTKEYCDYIVKKHKSGSAWACGVFGIDPDNVVVRFLLDFYKIPHEWIKGGAAEASEPVQEAAPGGMIDLMELL